ncbi:hypothetical protein BDN70DRAFT_928522 [Pholiota conissans]|uniref:Uncharacterized protein n=1 Tax=Pholiota conissans TaxID=109636 RepID=A0A9P5ZE60_9AGAR|nr:hypothetical protein BDN70DRAFT_928522 [Pholiota conissans]
MPSEDDSFPNSEEHFRSAFNQSDAPSELLKLLKEYPEYMVVVDLVVNYKWILKENPERAEELTRTVVALLDAPDAPVIDSETKISEIIRRRVAFLQTGCLEINDDTKDFGPTNDFLTGSLLSGFAFKYNLAQCSDQYGGILEGLDADPALANSEVLVTGACIQLLTAGSEIIQCSKSYFKSAKEVAAKLKAQKLAGAVKNEHALKLLELTILHAESGFKKENDMNNVWTILFPSQV